jgi:DNA invertase Pin-like site-specific DNA recombinase
MPRRRGGSTSAPAGPDYDKVRNVLVPYRRVSTREQAVSGAGLGAQRTSIEYGLGFRGATALTWACEDKGKSGKNLERAGLDAALAHIRAGEAGGIIVAKLDRLSRSLLDFAHLMAVADKEGWNIVALDLGVDLQTPAGKMMAGILAVFAEFERNVIAQRTRDGLAEKRSQGVRLGRKRSVDDNLMWAILSAYEAERNYTAVARWLNESGVPTPRGGKEWYPMVVSKIVNSQDGRAMLEQLEDVA